MGDERLLALRASGRSLVSDRAKALIPLADQGLECLSRPDFLHVMHDLVKSASLAIARRVRPARQACKNAEEVRRTQPRLAGHPQAPLAAQHQGEVRRAEVQRWEGVHSTYRHPLEALSLTLHPSPCRGGGGPQSRSCYGSIGHTKWPTRAARRKTKIRQGWETARAALHPHALTLRRPAPALEAWHTWAPQQVRVVQRASSAVEGRNGALA